MGDRGLQHNGIDEPMTVGKRIKLVRTEMLKVEQAALGKIVGVSAMSVSKWERDATDVNEQHLRVLADATGLTYEWFVSGKPVSDNNRDVGLLLEMVSDDVILALFKVLLNTYFEEAKGRYFDGFTDLPPPVDNGA